MVLFEELSSLYTSQEQNFEEVEKGKIEKFFLIFKKLIRRKKF